MFGLGAGEILIIAVFALIFIGPKKLPELARGLGKGIREFQRAKNDLVSEMHDTPEEPQQKEEKIETVVDQTKDETSLHPGTESMPTPSSDKTVESSTHTS
jgi:sec-independent protein translocase protein TatA